jgi:hypothetical protein
MKYFDEDGYPTEEALDEVANFDCCGDLYGFLSLIENLWNYPERFVLEDNKLYLSTGGWSGNEEIISYMQENFFWRLSWEKSIRGGHYWFDLSVFNKDKGK